MTEKPKEKAKSASTKKPPLLIPHYVCTGGCKTVSLTPGKCQVAGCPRVRNPLTECRCTDGKHGDLLFKNATRVSR